MYTQRFDVFAACVHYPAKLGDREYGKHECGIWKTVLAERCPYGSGEVQTAASPACQQMHGNKRRQFSADI